MHKNEEMDNFESIVELVKERPRNQTEILSKLFKSDESKYQLVKKHLDRAERLFILAYFREGNAIKNFLENKHEVGWRESSHRYYYYTPLSRKLYKKLIGLYSKKHKELITEILELYRAIEIAGYLQEMYLTDRKQVKFDVEGNRKERGNLVELSEAELATIITQNRRNSEEFLKNHKFTLRLPREKFNVDEESFKMLELKFQDFSKIISMPPFMYMAAFHKPKVPDYALDNSNKSILEAYTAPMYDKLGLLFGRLLNEGKINKEIEQNG